MFWLSSVFTRSDLAKVYAYYSNRGIAFVLLVMHHRNNRLQPLSVSKTVYIRQGKLVFFCMLQEMRGTAGWTRGHELRAEE